MDKPENPRDGLGALTPPPAPRSAPATGRGTNPEGSALVPGYVLAGRYRMVTRLGRGGMGEVWRADDLVLNLPIALKFVDAPNAVDRERILREVRLARQITHPAVCRVFDVGEAEGKLFYTLELIEGEDVGTLLRHAGRLPAERVLDIARQLFAGLAVAHARGVLHRDLKPANILIDDAGTVCITDFGIATARNEIGQRTLIGASAYMAPEQFSSGGEVSEQTDVYALGLILYELVVGHPPFPDSTRPQGAPPRPATVVNDIDPRLEQVVMASLAADPRLRPTAAPMVALLEAPVRGPLGGGWRLRPWLAGGALAVVILLAAVLASRYWPRPAATLTDRDTIILADFVNTTNEPVFDGALKVALAVALEQSAFLKVFSEDNIRETLRLMQRSTEERVTRSLAREIARREQLKALVAGSISKLGTQYVLALEAISAETGDVMAREQVEAAGSEEVLAALGQATSRLRAKLGESLNSIQRFDVSLARATTPSLEALHAYSLALDDGRFVTRLDVVPHLQRALELDPDFAMAHALLSGVYRNTGRSTEAAPLSRRAFELRDRVSERERFFISWRYYMDVEQDWEKALELSQSWTRTYPREAFAFNSLGLAQSSLGRHERAVEAFREAMRLDPRFVSPWSNAAGSLTALGRFDEAKAALADAARHGVDYISLRRQGYVLAFLENDATAMARELKSAAATPEAVWSTNWQARDALYAGQLRVAHERFQGSIRSALGVNFPEFAAQWTMEDAEGHAIVEQCGVALDEVASGLSLRRDNFTLERAARTLALCGAESKANGLLDELARRFGSATLTQKLHRPVAQAAAALARGDAARAVAELDAARQFDHAPAAEYWPAYLTGLARLRLGDGRAASEAFRDITTHRGEAPNSPLFALAHLGLARAARLTNDSAEARKNYDAFFEIWKAADPDLPVLIRAKSESAALQ